MYRSRRAGRRGGSALRGGGGAAGGGRGGRGGGRAPAAAEQRTTQAGATHRAGGGLVPAGGGRGGAAGRSGSGTRPDRSRGKIPGATRGSIRSELSIRRCSIRTGAEATVGALLADLQKQGDRTRRSTISVWLLKARQGRRRRRGRRCVHRRLGTGERRRWVLPVRRSRARAGCRGADSVRVSSCPHTLPAAVRGGPSLVGAARARARRRPTRWHVRSRSPAHTPSARPHALDRRAGRLHLRHVRRAVGARSRSCTWCYAVVLLERRRSTSLIGGVGRAGRCRRKAAVRDVGDGRVERARRRGDPRHALGDVDHRDGAAAADASGARPNAMAVAPMRCRIC